LRTLDRDRAARLVDDAVHRREPQPGPLPRLLGREKRLEDSLTDLVRHTDAGVADDERDPARRRSLGCVDHIVRRDRQHAAVEHRVSRVDGEVEQHLLELSAIGAHAGERRRRREAKLDVLADDSLQHRRDPLGDLGEIEHCRLEHLLSAEGEELMRQ
jgi:hypothetical protein